MSHKSEFVVHSACLENMLEHLSTIIYPNEHYINAKGHKNLFILKILRFSICLLCIFLHILYSKCIVRLLLQIPLQTILQCHPTNRINILFQNTNSCHHLLSAFNSIFIADDDCYRKVAFLKLT